MLGNEWCDSLSHVHVDELAGRILLSCRLLGLEILLAVEPLEDILCVALVEAGLDVDSRRNNHEARNMFLRPWPREGLADHLWEELEREKASGEIIDLQRLFPSVLGEFVLVCCDTSVEDQIVDSIYLLDDLLAEGTHAGKAALVELPDLDSLGRVDAGDLEEGLFCGFTLLDIADTQDYQAGAADQDVFCGFVAETHVTSSDQRSLVEELVWWGDGEGLEGLFGEVVEEWCHCG